MSSGSVLIHGGLVVTVDRDRRIIRDGAILVEDGRIVEVGKTDQLKGNSAAIKIDASKMVVTPGFVDAHVHVTTEHLVRGFVPDDTPLLPWIFNWIVPLYSETRPEEEFLSAKLAFTELIKTGTTCFSEPGTTLNVDQVVKAMGETGIRGTVGRWAWDLPPEPKKYVMSSKQALNSSEETIRKFDGAQNGRVQAWACVVGENTCSDELVAGAKDLADRYQTGMHMHQSAVGEEVDAFVKEKGERPIVHWLKMGVLGPNLLMSHMVYLTEKEVDLLKASDAKVVFCPTSANRLAYGALKNGIIPEAIERGVCVALGCDGANCSDMFDMVRAMHIMAGSWKDARVNPAKTSSEKVLEMATIDGARALGLQDEIGSLEVGKKADIVLFDRRTPEWVPLFNVVNSLVYSASGSSVDTVVVDGKVVMRHRKIDGLDEESLYDAVQKAGQNLIERSGLKLQSRWPVN
jgi:cytosine/adenosine deaminase-related metal-dependent hydrolase